MHKKPVALIVFLVIICFFSTASALYVTDDFGISHDYLTEGTAGTIWHGFLGLGEGETVDALNASIDRPGELYMASTNGTWSEPWNPLGPFLYRTADADFVARVTVTDYQNILHNNCGILARAPKSPDDLGGPGEDWLAIDYFPIWGCGNFVRSANDGVRTENCNNHLQFNLHPYMKLQREGNTFHFYTSPDNSSWDEMICSPLIRADLDGVPLQVGLCQATYSSNQGYVAFDDFSLDGASGLGRLVIEETDDSTEVYEAGDPPYDTYTVVLEGDEPTSTVTVMINYDSQIEVSPSILSFNSSNYTTPRTVTVSAIDNFLPDGHRTTIINHTTITSDENYQDKSLDISVNIYDDDRTGDLIKDGYIDFDDLKFIVYRWLLDCSPDAYCDGADLTGLLGKTPNPGNVDAKDIAIFAAHWFEGPLLITEFMASNTAYFETLVNGITASPDWLEILNASPSQMNLEGWFLTDDPNNLSKWPFGSVTINPGQYLVVFASGQETNDFVDDLGYLHTNFRLNADGDFLAIVEPDGKTISHQYSLYPPQRENFSYGIKGERQGYFAVATPEEQNGQVYSGFVRDTKFDTDRGFYNQEFDVKITTATPGAIIRYTFNGSEPTLTNGYTYTGPIHITKTTCLRAAAFKEDLIPTNVDTQTYIFLNDFWAQTRPAGYPTETYLPGYPLDYDIDQDVIGPANLFGDVYRNTYIEDLKAFPILSIVMNVDDLFGYENGIYANSPMEGELWERAASLEQIDPDNQEEFQVNMAIRMQGGYGAYAFEQPKHNFRFIFKRPYGPSKLRFKLFDDTNVDQFDQLVLRTPCHDSWLTAQTYFRRQGLYIKDRWHRAVQREMGHVSIHGKWVHLYLNGLYWGIYELVERPNQAFAASYFGGDKEQYDAIGSGSPRGTSNLDSWNTMFAIADGGGQYGSLENNAAYLELQEHLDIVNLADYIIYNVYSAISDWPGWNYYAAKKREPGAPFRFFSWDSEASMTSDRLEYNKLGGINAGPGHLYTKLKSNAEFRLLMADRLYRHLKNTGVLTQARAAQLFQAELNGVEPGLGPESARWGDSWESVPLTKADWLDLQQFHFNTFFPQRADIVLGFFYNDDVYPDTEAPYFNQPGGQITPGFALTITNPNGTGTIYYTLDGTDPREAFTGNVVGTPYGSSITLNETTHVKARVKDGTEWSALCEAVFDTGLVKNNLRITEIMYHPKDTGDPNDPNKEFIELRNIGAETINLNLVSFTEGIHFTFGDIQLASGDYIILVHDLDAFEAQYDTAGMNIAGEYTGRLANEGEQIRLQDAMGQTVLDFEYKDGWCDITDGDGYSLTINDETNPDPDSWAWKKFWSASTYIGGSPGTGDNGQRWGDVVINEILAHSDIYPNDWIELHNTTNAPINITGWFLSDNENDLTKYEIPSTTIQANGYTVFTQDDHFGPYFALSENGETVYLTSGYDNADLTGYREQEDFGASENNVAFGRHQKSTGTYNFVAMSQNTPGAFFEGAPNAYPKVGPIVISEIMYHPDGDLDAEYIELYNITDSTVNLYDTGGNPWKFTDGIIYTFPYPTNLPANSYMLVVKNYTAFYSQFSPPPGVQVLEWTDGGLNNEGEKLEISMPGDVNDLGILQYIRIDRVNYSDGSQHNDFYGIDDPWPADADGLGYSLTKLHYNLYGNDPNNWDAFLPSPGEENVIQTPPEKAINQNPPNGAADQPTFLTLSWSNGGGATNYDVYFGTDPTPGASEYKTNTDNTTYNSGTLNYSTTYYWRIDAKNLAGTTVGDTWSFTTEAQTFNLLVDLDAKDLALGILSSWTNTGTLAGSFENQGTTPQVQIIDDVQAVTFDGSDKLQSTFTAPSSITANESFTVAIWAYNPSIATEECMLNWSHRGGPAGTCAQINYGSSAAFGAVTHWDWPDMGFDGGIPAAGQWHHIAVTFDGATEKVYVDGQPNANEDKTLSMYSGDPIYLGCADGNTKWFSGSLASVKIFDYALSPEEITNLTNDNPEWTLLTYDDFETGWGNYTDGGDDCSLYTYNPSYPPNYAHQGNKAANIQDDKADESSFYHTYGIDVHTPGHNQIKIDFWFYVVDFEPEEDFWVQYYDGSSWQTIATYTFQVDFENGQFYFAEIIIDELTYNFPNDMKIKFQCDASGKADDVYIDEIRVSAK